MSTYQTKIDKLQRNHLTLFFVNILVPIKHLLNFLTHSKYSSCELLPLNDRTVSLIPIWLQVLQVFCLLSLPLSSASSSLFGSNSVSTIAFHCTLRACLCWGCKLFLCIICMRASLHFFPNLIWSRIPVISSRISSWDHCKPISCACSKLIPLGISSLSPTIVYQFPQFTHKSKQQSLSNQVTNSHHN
jgi:hypothetical protein